MADPNETREKLKSAVLALRKMKAKLTEKDRAATQPIAVIGIGCRFPGASNSPQAFWEFLKAGGNGMTAIPTDRWDSDLWFDPQQTPGKLYSNQAAFISDVDCFDAAFFGISPAEAAGMDPQQRLILEVSWHALEHAGIIPAALKNSRTGVFVGQMFADYQHLQIKTGDPEMINTFYATGTEYSFNPGRLSYLLGLQGPCLMLDTACSSGLVAVHLAAQSLRTGESNLALAGAVNLMLTPETTVSICSIGALSKEGRCATFDAAGDGYARGEGCGVVVLKRQSDAIRDGDRILALLNGSAVNHDGTGGGLTVPNGPAQEQLIRTAMAQAGIQPQDLDYLEAHGTGTSLGDPIEVNAFSRVYCKDRKSEDALIIGSVKSNIGHLEGAAGISGLIKLVLAIHHGEIPANLHFNTPNPHIDWDHLPVTVPTQTTPWPTRGEQRTGAVSSFGLSGINGHAVVSKPQVQPHVSSQETNQPALLVISAKSPEALRAYAVDYQTFLSKNKLSLHDLAYSSQRDRTAFDYRDFVVLEADTDPVEALAPLLVEGREHRPVPKRTARPVFVYTGQGAQWAGMGAGLIDDEVFRRELETVAQALAPHWDGSVWDHLTASADQSQLDQTQILQPVLFALQVALTRRLAGLGVTPAAVIGHSVGEVAAAHIAGVLTLEDAARVIVHRGRLMQAATGKGKMAAVGLSESETRSWIKGYDSLGIAAINSRTAVVVSGGAEQLDAMLADLPTDVFQKILPVDYAFHSPQMAPAAAELQQLLDSINPNPPRLHIASTVSGARYQSGDYDAAYWAANMTQPVRFADAVDSLISGGQTHFLEIGPHPALRNYLNGLLDLAAVPGYVSGTLQRGVNDLVALTAATGALWKSGVTIQWDGLHDRPCQRIDLPTYPFQRKRFWVDLPQTVQQHEPPTGRFYQETWIPQALESAPPKGSFVLVGTHSPLLQSLEDTITSGVGNCRRAADFKALDQLDLSDTDHVMLVIPADFDGEPGAAEIGSKTLAPTRLLNLLARKTAGSDTRIWIVSDLDHTPNLSTLVASAALGFARGMALEQPANWGGSIQINPMEPTTAAAAILAETSTNDDEDQIRLTSEKRFVKRLQPFTPVAAVQSYAGDGSYLITGGLGGIGLKLAAHMAAAGAGCLLLTGRSPLPPKDTWDHPDINDRNRYRIEAIRDLESLGARVEYMAADAVDEAAMGRVFDRFNADLPPLRGIMHASGVARETPLSELRDDELAATLQPKVAGSWLLHQLAGELDFFVCFSSISSVWGSPELAHYAAANRFEDAFCDYRAAQGKPALSINWGPWADGGMATPEIAARLARSGLTAMPPQHALADMERLMADGAVHAVVADVDWNLFKDIYEAGERRKLLEHIKSTSPAPKTTAQGNLREYLLGKLSAALGKSTQAIATDQPLDTLGVDSLISVDLKARLQKDWSVNISVTDLLDGRTLDQLLDHLQGSEKAKPKLDTATWLKQTLAASLGKSIAELETAASLSALGMDSLASVDLKTKVQKHLGVSLPVTDFLDADSVDDLVRRIGGGGQVAAKAVIRTQHNRLLVFPKPNPNAAMRLFCFAYAGGGPGIYKSWPNHLPDHIEVCAVQLQGRGARLGEPALKRMKRIAAGIVDGLEPFLDRPYAFFGHCMGAILMYEVTLELRRRGVNLPRHLFPSGAPAPNLYIMPFVHNQPESSLLDLLKLINFSSTDALLADAEMKAVMLPTLRADFEAVSFYPEEYETETPLDIPMTGFGAWEDLFAAPLGVQDWQRFSTFPYQVHMIHGDHYFLETEKDFIFSHLIPLLEQSQPQAQTQPEVEPQEANEVAVLPEGAEKIENAAAPDPAWYSIINPNPAARLRLICFPPAWTQADDYHQWPDALPSTVEVVRINYPGREQREQEPAYTDFNEWCEQMTPVIAGMLDKPFAFFGHCIGAVLAYEITRNLQTHHGVSPRHLFLSAAPSPRYYVLPMAHRQPDDKVLELLHLLKFDRATDWWRNQDAEPEILAMLRADFQAMAGYHYQPGPRITTPITNFATWDDLWVSPIGSQLWREHTSGAFNQFMRDGHHFSLAEDRRFIQQIVVQELLAHLG